MPSRPLEWEESNAGWYRVVMTTQVTQLGRWVLQFVVAYTERLTIHQHSNPIRDLHRSAFVPYSFPFR
jgi:hypothetical protein